MTTLPPEEQSISLAKYLEDNKDLLTILGVFIAVIAFSTNLSIKLIAALISFSAFTCATLIMIEFWRKKPDGRPSILVVFFRRSLSFLALTLFFYWFTVFDAIYPDFIFPVAAILILELVGLLIAKGKERSERFKNGFRNLQQKKKLYYTFVIISSFIILVIARFIANHIELPIFKATVLIIKTSSTLTGPVL